MNPFVSIMVRTFATRRFRIAAVLLGVMLGVTGQARSGTVILDFTGGGLAGAGLSLTAGWTFTLSAPTTVGGLAFWTPGTSVVQSHQVGLWDGSGALLASTTISGSGTTSDPSTGLGGRWLENPIAPLTLTTGQTYTLGAFFAQGSSDAPVLIASTVTTIPGVTYVGGLSP